MPNTIVCRLMLGASTFCFFKVCGIAPQAQAQNIAVDPVTSNSGVSSSVTSNAKALKPQASALVHDTALNQGLTRSSMQLMPSVALSLNTAVQRVRLAQVANGLNQQMAMERAIAAEPVGLQFSDLPMVKDLVKDLVDDSGNLDIAKGLPFSVGLGDVMGQTGIVLSTDF